MTKWTRLACMLVMVAACGKGGDKPAPKPVDEPVVTKEEPKPAPKAEPKAEPAKTSDIPKATAADMEYVAKLDDWMKFTFKPAQDTFIEMEMKPVVKNGVQAFDVYADGKVIDTIESGIKPDEHGMEVKARLSAMKEGVMAVVHATKTTGKPADYWQGRVYEWNGKMALKRKFADEQVYDPSKDGI